MIERHTTYRARCDCCGDYMDFLVDRSSKVAAGLRKCKWKVDGKTMICPACLTLEEEERRTMAMMTEMKSGRCRKCGSHLADVWEGGIRIGLYCASCKEEKRF